jgi:CRP-like cAMP-binding protein
MVLEPTKVIELFMTSPNIQTFKTGETIFEFNETGDVMFGLIEGEVALWVAGVVFETIKPGDVSGAGALVQIPHT